MVLLLVLLCSLQTEDAKARELLDACAGKLRTAQTLSVKYASELGEQPLKVTVSARRPNLLRLAVDDGSGPDITLFDGTSCWSIEAKRVRKGPQSIPRFNAWTSDPVMALYFRDAGRLLTKAADVSIRREGDGAKAVTLLSWTRRSGPDVLLFKLWLDSASLPQRFERSKRGSDEKETLTYESIDLAANLPETTWKYDPPAGALDKDAQDPGAAVLAVGGDAPEFRVIDLNEKEVKLSDFKGKPVFLSFWFLR